MIAPLNVALVGGGPGGLAPLCGLADGYGVWPRLLRRSIRLPGDAMNGA